MHLPIYAQRLEQCLGHTKYSLSIHRISEYDTCVHVSMYRVTKINVSVCWEREKQQLHSCGPVALEKMLLQPSFRFPRQEGLLGILTEPRTGDREA